MCADGGEKGGFVPKGLPLPGSHPAGMSYGMMVLEELNLPAEEVESYAAAMRKFREERLEILMAGVEFCAREIAKEEPVRQFLLKLVEGADEKMKRGPE